MIVIIAMAAAIAIAVDCGHRDEIKRYVAARGGEVDRIDEHIFDLGPFWYKNKHQHVYKATLKDGRIVWMRTNLFGNDWVWNE